MNLVYIGVLIFFISISLAIFNLSIVYAYERLMEIIAKENKRLFAEGYKDPSTDKSAKPKKHKWKIKKDISKN